MACSETVKEMNERLDGTYECSEEDEELQRRFHSLIKPHHHCYVHPEKASASTIRKTIGKLKNAILEFILCILNLFKVKFY